MKISEYTILEDAFHRSFGFMLNRLADAGYIKGDPHSPTREPTRDYVEQQCFNEFMCALEDGGVELEDAEVTKT
jgi:hypothetical protein